MNSSQNGGAWQNLRSTRIDKRAVVRRLKKAELASTRHARKFVLERLSNARLVKREISIWALLIGFMIAGMGAQFWLSQRGYTVSAPRASGTYAEGLLGPVGSLNPLYASSSAELSAARLLFSSLYSYDYTNSLSQDLATKLSVSDDGKVYTVSLRRDAKWHDGAPLTAADVAFTVNLIKNPASRSSLRITWQDISVKATDDYTVQFTLPAAHAAFSHALTFFVLPSHILSKINAGAIRENTFSNNPVGSGPFVFKVSQRSDAITNHEIIHMIANEDYYRGRPRLDQFEIYSYSKQDDIRAALKNSEINGTPDISGVTADDLGSLYRVTANPLANGVYALFNNKNTILADRSVRKALQLGTDYKAVRTAAGEHVLPLTLPFLDGQVQGDVPKPPDLDMAKAAVMLDDAGWRLQGGIRVKDGVSLKLTVTTIRDSQSVRVADELKRQWSALGIETTVDPVDVSSVSAGFVQNVLQARKYDVLVYELVLGADPDVYAYWHSSQISQSGFNFANYNNKTADSALASARSRSDIALRDAKYIAFARQWIDDAPSLALYRPVVEYVSNNHNTSVASSDEFIAATDRYATVLSWSVDSDTVYKTP